MNKEQQDKLWNELSEESKEYILSINKELDEEYEKYNKEYENKLANYSLQKAIMLEDLFGEHNLNPKQIKTWEDVEKKYPDLYGSQKTNLFFFNAFSWDTKCINKCITTLKISKLIELGYGGMVSEEEWEDEFIEKFVVKWCATDNHPFYDCETRHNIFIAFHTPEQREEFMSYSENVQLVRDYYMI